MCCGPIDDLVDSVGGFFGDALDTVGDVVGNILENPLPVIETIALTVALGPEGLALGLEASTTAAIAGAAVSAMNGGNIQDIAIAAGTAYLGSEVGREAGKAVAANEAVKAMDKVTQATIKQVVTSSSASAATVALRGGSLEDILKAGTTEIGRAHV